MTHALRLLALAALSISLSSPLQADPLTSPPLPETTQPKIEDGLSMLESGARRLMEGLFGEIEPALKDLSSTLQSYEPFVREMMALMGDVKNYEAPERLPNGDVLLRRKPDAPPPPLPARPIDPNAPIDQGDPLPDGGIEL